MYESLTPYRTFKIMYMRRALYEPRTVYRILQLEYEPRTHESRNIFTSPKTDPHWSLAVNQPFIHDSQTCMCHEPCIGHGRCAEHSWTWVCVTNSYVTNYEYEPKQTRTPHPQSTSHFNMIQEHAYGSRTLYESRTTCRIFEFMYRSHEHCKSYWLYTGYSRSCIWDELYMAHELCIGYSRTWVWVTNSWVTNYIYEPTLTLS